MCEGRGGYKRYRYREYFFDAKSDITSLLSMVEALQNEKALEIFANYYILYSVCCMVMLWLTY